MNSIRRTDYVLLAILSIPLFFNSLNIYFVSDNIAHIQKAWDNLFNFDYYYYRPVSVLTLVIDRWIWGASAAGYHLSNWLIHLFNVFLVYRITYLFKPSREIAFAAALLFLIHPIHSLNIFWISGRTDMVCSFFFLLSFYQALRWLRGKGKQGRYWSLIFFLVSLMAKEMALGLPFILLGLLWYEKQWNRKNILGLILPYFVIIVLVFLFRFNAGNRELLANEVHNITNPLVLLKNLAVYLGLLAVPGGHVAIADFLGANQLLFSFLAIGGLAGTGFILFKYRVSRRVQFWTLFTILSLLPVLRLVMRWYLYIPSVGFVIAVTLWIYELGKTRWIARSVIASIFIVFSFFLIQQQNRWITAGELAKDLSSRYVQEIQERQITRAAFLTVPAEVKEIPVFMYGFQEFLSFRVDEKMDNTRLPDIVVLSKISLSESSELQKLEISKIDSLTYELSLLNTHSQFIFPEHSGFISGRERPKKGMIIQTEIARTEIVELDLLGRTKRIRIRLLDPVIQLIH